MNCMQMKNLQSCVLQNTSAWLSVNFFLLLCLHINFQQVMSGAWTAAGIDWWKNQHRLTAGNG